MNRPSVLVVDDDVDITANVSDILTDLGYDVDFANDGASALRLVHARPYDVALLDFKMPDMDGAVLYQEIKKLRPEVVAIMVTAYAGDDGVRRALDAGTWKVLRKPVDLPHLLGLVEQALREPLVLLVDDDPDFCQTLWQILRENNYRVACAIDKHSAKRLLEQHDYDLVLLDMKLNETDGGSEVFADVQALHPGTRTILMTGFRSEMADVIDGLLRQGAANVIYKPINVGRLLQEIGRS